MPPRKPSKLKLGAMARRNVLRRARQQGGVWTVLAVGAYGARTLSKIARREPEIVHQQELKPGEAITITHTGESRGQLARRQAAEHATAKADAKAAKRQAKVAKRDAKAARKAG